MLGFRYEWYTKGIYVPPGVDVTQAALEACQDYEPIPDNAQFPF